MAGEGGASAWRSKSLSPPRDRIGYRFGVFSVDLRAGELWRQGLRVRLHQQPFALLCLLLERPGEVVTREEIARSLWTEDTFVDFEHGVNAAVGRVREALRDKASAPRYIETLPRRGYRFLGPVEVLLKAGPETGETRSGLEADNPVQEDGFVSQEIFCEAQGQTAATQPLPVGGSWLTTPEALPRLPGQRARLFFLLLQAMYLSFSLGVLANLAEVEGLCDLVTGGQIWFYGATALAACGIPLRLYLTGLVVLRPPLALARFLKVWPLVLAVDLAGALSPLLLLDHISFGLALVCVAPLVYAPFAERSLALMGAVAEDR